MKYIYIFLIALIAVSCGQDKRPIVGETAFQKMMNSDFKDATKSPLKDKDRKNFRGLDFFSFDSTYVVEANLKRTPDETPFKMKTTTSRLPNYVKYGEITFELKGEWYQLDVFQNLDLIEEEGYEDYLFLPFLDDTNGEDSYGGGRYVDTRQPEGSTMIIDFNTAYNPLCVYNEKYSCPIVPRQNYVSTRIEAGVKVFDKH
jgi:hypothetical protein